ncbi:MAG: sigma-54-dependent Fis family transcriptional regulator [Myxococcales bacterium]|nr:sigma-54-dependent Fis family transcriptional regulator [Myxococcales bacterium]
MRELLARQLGRRGFEVSTASGGEDALAQVAGADFDVVLTDLNMPRVNGAQVCERITQSRPDIPVIVVTAFGSLDTAVAAIRAGAYDFVTKPFDLEQLLMTLERALGLRRLKDEVRRLRESAAVAGERGAVGDSAGLRTAYEVLGRVASTDMTVLIGGESGTGKELAARFVHAHSPRAPRPFVALNCAALPEALLESELFGHVKGAFTDAKAQRTGIFQEAEGGTLFLDEVGDLPAALQPKLLRALQERTIRPVGANAEVPIDVRVVAASHRDLEAAVAQGRFREDLFYRLNVVSVELPPLRARGNDVLLLAQAFVKDFAARLGRKVVGVSPQVAQKLLAYRWPGNVRELQNCIQRAVALTRFEEVSVEDLPEKVRAYQATEVLLEGVDSSALVPLEEMERRYVLRVLEVVGGSKVEAARTLGIDRKTLHRKLEAWGAPRPHPAPGT